MRIIPFTPALLILGLAAGEEDTATEPVTVVLRLINSQLSSSIRFDEEGEPERSQRSLHYRCRLPESVEIDGTVYPLMNVGRPSLTSVLADGKEVPQPDDPFSGRINQHFSLGRVGNRDRAAEVMLCPQLPVDGKPAALTITGTIPVHITAGDPLEVRADASGGRQVLAVEGLPEDAVVLTETREREVVLDMTRVARKRLCGQRLLDAAGEEVIINSYSSSSNDRQRLTVTIGSRNPFDVVELRFVRKLIERDLDFTIEGLTVPWPDALPEVGGEDAAGAALEGPRF